VSKQVNYCIILLYRITFYLLHVTYITSSDSSHNVAFPVHHTITTQMQLVLHFTSE